MTNEPRRTPVRHRAGSGVGLAASAATFFRHGDKLSGPEVDAMIDAVAEAGFTGLCIRTEDYDAAVADGSTSVAWVESLVARQLFVPTVEVAFLRPGVVDRDALVSAHRHLVDVAAAVGARSVIAVVFDMGRPDAGPEPMIDDAGLGALCDLAGDHGVGVSLEFMPFSPVATLGAAVELMHRLDRDNLGLVLDVWHWMRQPGGPRPDELADVPADRLHVLQLNDACSIPAADLLGESADRLLPGEGDADFASLFAALETSGAEPVVVSEVFSTRLRGLGARRNAVLQRAAAEQALGARVHAVSGASAHPS